MIIVSPVIFIPWQMHRGKNLFIMIHNPGTGLPALIVIFLLKAMDISGQKEQQDYVIYGASGPGIPLHLTGKTAEGSKLHVIMFMKAVVSNVTNTFTSQSLQKQERMHTFI